MFLSILADQVGSFHAERENQKVWLQLIDKERPDPPLWLFEVESVIEEDAFVAEKETTRLELSTENLKKIIKKVGRLSQLTNADLELNYVDLNVQEETYNALAQYYTPLKLMLIDKPDYSIFLFVLKDFKEPDFSLLNPPKTVIAPAEVREKGQTGANNAWIRNAAVSIWSKFSGPWTREETQTTATAVRSLESKLLNNSKFSVVELKAQNGKVGKNDQGIYRQFEGPALGGK